MSFGGRGRSSILPFNLETVAGDHDFHVVNFTPGVCLHVDIKPNEGEDMILYYRGRTFILVSCIIMSLLLLMLLLLLLTMLLLLPLMPMLMMLDLAVLLLPGAFKVVAYAAYDNVDAESKILNVARYLGGANDVLLMLLLVVVLICDIICDALLMLLLLLLLLLCYRFCKQCPCLVGGLHL